LKVVEPRDPKNWSGIICVYYPAKFEEEVKSILAERRIHATMRGGYIRIGIDFYNTSKQMDITADALSLISRLGEKKGRGPRQTQGRSADSGKKRVKS
jgi:selenocysteine lyase/cysteine desulfurase